MKSITILALTLLISLSGFATVQKPDIIFYNGREYPLHSYPLEQYFEKYPDKRPTNKGRVMSTGLWRGYIATFEVTDGQVFLKDIQIEVWKDSATIGDYDIKLVSVMQNVFPGQIKVKV